MKHLTKVDIFYCFPPDHFASSSSTIIVFIMSYKEGIVEAITELKDRTGSSMIAIKKYMQEKLPKDKKWQNAIFLKALKVRVRWCVIVIVSSSFKNDIPVMVVATIYLLLLLVVVVVVVVVSR